MEYFFDLEKAYDTTWKGGIMKDLHEMGLKGRLPLFIDNFLKGRKFKVRLDNTHSSLNPQEEGVINDEASICTAKLLAIEAAIEYIWDSSDEEFMIITDSLSSLQALKSQKLNNPIVSNILHMCHYLSGHKDIIFYFLLFYLLHQWNAEEMTLSYAGPELAMPISQTAIY